MALEVIYHSGAPDALWKPALLPVYLLSGEEDRLKDEAARALIARAVAEDWHDFDLESLDASSHTAEAILSAAAQTPFGSERRGVVVKGLEQWRDRAKQGEADRLAEGLGTLPRTACLVLVTAAQDEEARRKTAVTTKLDTAVKKVGALVLCRAMRGDALSGWIANRVSAAGKRIMPDASELLVETVGHDLLPLANEIDKLVAYAGKRSEVTARDVGLVVASSPEDVMFGAVEAITRRQTDLALTLLAELHRYDPKPQAVAGKLLALLSRQYRMLWQAKFLTEGRVNPRDVRALPPDLASELPIEGNIAQLAFKAGDLFAAAKTWTWADLQLSLERLLLCDLANKGAVTEEAGAFGSDAVGNLQILALQLTGASPSCVR